MLLNRSSCHCLFFLHLHAEKQKGISPFPRNAAADANARSLVIRVIACQVRSLSSCNDPMLNTSSIQCLSCNYLFVRYIPTMHFNQYFTESEALSKKLKAIHFVLIDNVMSEFRNTWHEENVNQDDCVIK